MVAHAPALQKQRQEDGEFETSQDFNSKCQTKLSHLGYKVLDLILRAAKQINNRDFFKECLLFLKQSLTIALTGLEPAI